MNPGSVLKSTNNLQKSAQVDFCRVFFCFLFASLMFLSFGCRSEASNTTDASTREADVVLPASDSLSSSERPGSADSSGTASMTVEADSLTAQVPVEPGLQKKDSPKPLKKPLMKFAKTVLNFDTLLAGDVIVEEFHFTNTGNADLQIQNVTASCGCSQPFFPFIPIKPGEKNVITVKYNSTGKEGPQKPKITVYSNASAKPVNLFLSGTVLPKETK